MFKHTVTYTDYNGVERTEDLYFNLTQAEAIILDNSVPGGLGMKLDRIGKSADNVEIMETMLFLIRKTYGVKSEDGRRFIKNDAIFDEFCQTEAFNVFFTDLCTDLNFSAKFLRGVLPEIPDEEWQKIEKEHLVDKFKALQD